MLNEIWCKRDPERCTLPIIWAASETVEFDEDFP